MPLNFADIGFCSSYLGLSLAKTHKIKIYHRHPGFISGFNLIKLFREEYPINLSPSKWRVHPALVLLSARVTEVEAILTPDHPSNGFFT